MEEAPRSSKRLFPSFASITAVCKTQCRRMVGLEGRGRGAEREEKEGRAEVVPRRNKKKKEEGKNENPLASKCFQRN